MPIVHFTAKGIPYFILPHDIRGVFSLKHDSDICLEKGLGHGTEGNAVVQFTNGDCLVTDITLDQFLTECFHIRRPSNIVVPQTQGQIVAR